MRVSISDSVAQDVIVYDLDTRQPILGCFEADDETGEYAYYDSDGMTIRGEDIGRLTRRKVGNIRILFIDKLVAEWEKAYL